jgi:hypothetical protein
MSVLDSLELPTVSDFHHWEILVKMNPRINILNTNTGTPATISIDSTGDFTGKVFQMSIAGTMSRKVHR